MKSLLTVLLTAAAITAAAAQSPVPQGWRFVVSVDARPVGAVSEQTQRIVDALFPKGSATVEYLTDGRSVRGSIQGGYFGFVDGTIRLARVGASSEIVLDPTTHTYAPGKKVAFGGRSQPAVIESNRIDAFRDILGYRAQLVRVAYRQAVEVPSGASGGGTVMRDVSADVESWCAPAPLVPKSMTSMMDLTARMAPGDVSYGEACQTPLASTVRMSVLPGIEVSMAVQTIQRVQNVPASTFAIPDGYTPRS